MTSKNAKFQKKEEEDVVDDEGCLEQHEQEQEEGDEKRTKSKRCEQCAKSENVITASQYRARKNNPLLFSGVGCVSVCVCACVNRHHSGTDPLGNTSELMKINFSRKSAEAIAALIREMSPRRRYWHSLVLMSVAFEPMASIGSAHVHSTANNFQIMIKCIPEFKTSSAIVNHKKDTKDTTSTGPYFA